MAGRQAGGGGRQGMHYREAVPEDAFGMARVYLASWRQAYRGIIPERLLARMSLAREVAGFRRTVAHGRAGGHALVATHRSGIVGLATAGRDRRDRSGATAELYTLYVAPSWQSRGVGRGLMGLAAEALLADGYHTLSVWVLRDNPARSFYARLGGQLVGSDTTRFGDVELPVVGYRWGDLFELEEQARRLSSIDVPLAMPDVS